MKKNQYKQKEIIKIKKKNSQIKYNCKMIKSIKFRKKILKFLKKKWGQKKKSLSLKIYIKIYNLNIMHFYKNQVLFTL